MKNILAVIVFAISGLVFLCGLKSEIQRTVYDYEGSGLLLIVISLFFIILSLCVIFFWKKK